RPDRSGVTPDLPGISAVQTIRRFAGTRQDFLRAVAFPPLRPAAFFCAVVPPCLALPPEPDFFPPRLDAPGEFAILAARSFDIPLSFSASYCFSFLTLALRVGMTTSLTLGGRILTET